MGRFDGRVAIVTGASRGIGYAIAERLVSDGAKVVITARKEESLREAAVQLGEENVAFVAGHADNESHQDETIATAISQFGRLDFLVNNTGINPAWGPVLSMELSAGQKLFNVNVLAAVQWTQKAHAAWLKDNGGAIVNITSVAGMRPAPDIGLYGASKAALIHVTEELAYELAPDIRVNAVAPAVVKTRMAGVMFEGREEEVASKYPLGRLGLPEEIAAAATFLLSDDASWITGKCVPVDGGLLLTGGV